MLSNDIVMTDGVTPITCTLVSREGMSSVRRETGAETAVAKSLVIKNTVDFANQSSKNRHLIQLSWNEEDATTGELYPVSVHTVITRHKKVTDAGVKLGLVYLIDMIDDVTNISDILLGGN